MAVKLDTKTKTYIIDTKIKRNDGSYYHYVYRDPKNPDFKSKRYVQSLEYEIVEKKKQEINGCAIDIHTLNDLFERYYKSCETEMSQLTLYNYDQMFNNVISPFFENRLSYFFNVNKLESYKLMVAKKDICGERKKHYLIVVRKLIEYARKIKLINSDTKDDCLYSVEYFKVKVKPKTKPRNRYATLEEIRAVIEYQKTDNDRDILNFLYFSGLRIGEFLGIKIKDISFSDNIATINIERQRTPFNIETTRLKTSSSYKKIAFVNENATRLKEYIKRNNLQEEDYLTSSYSRDKLRLMIDKATDKLQLEHITLHGFGRKSINTELYKLGADSKVRKVLLGQSSELVNEQNYVDNDEAFNKGVDYLKKISH